MKKTLSLLGLAIIGLVGQKEAKAQSVWNTFTTPHGYIKLGPANPGWAHIFTDQNNFIFNKNLYTYTGGFSTYNSNVDLRLQLDGSTKLKIEKVNGNVLIGNNAYNSSHDVRLWVETNTDSTGRIGVQSISKYASPWGYGVVSVFPTNQFKAFVAKNEATNKEVFVVEGDGHVFATEVTVMLAPFPDYVFADDYSLMPISDVEEYIEENRHLPNIPSAEEIESSGIGVGELQLKQMEKIEELMLYIIELKNEIEVLKQEVSIK